MSDAPRQKTFLLARPETRALEWIARRLPRWVMPDHLTALGVLAAIGIAAAYALSNRDPVWLWAASGLLVVHWLGDSLDGTLARVRRSERPRYGYYLDHLVDAIATALIGIGLGLSPYMLLATGMVIVIAYLVLSINTYLETKVFGVFSLGYGRLGPTEARVGLILANTVMALGIAPVVIGMSILDFAVLGLAGVMVVALGVRAFRNLRELARLEPPAAQAAVIVIAYLVLSINTYLETKVFGVFSLGYGRLGPTEARVGLILVNTVMALGIAPVVIGMSILDFAVLGLAGVMVVALGVRAFRNLRELARLEPPAAQAGS